MVRRERRKPDVLANRVTEIDVFLPFVCDGNRPPHDVAPSVSQCVGDVVTINRARQPVPGHGHAFSVTGFIGATRQDEPFSRLEVDHALGERTNPKLWPREVLQDRHLTPDHARGGPDPLRVLGVDLATAVGEVEPGDIHPGLDHPGEDVLVPGGGTDRGNNLGAAHAS